MKRTNNTARTTTRAMGIAGLAVLALTAVACNKAKPDTTPVPQIMPRVSITSVKGDTESELLAAIYARVLENAGVRVTRKDPIDMDRAQYYQALLDGQFQMIPEHSGDLLHFVLDGVDTGTVPSTTQPSEPATTRAPITIPVTTVPATTVAGETTVPASDTTGAATTTSAESTTTSAASTTTDAGSTTTTTLAPTNARSLVAQIIAINSTIPGTMIAYNGGIAESRQVIACSTEAMKALSSYQMFTLTDLASVAPQVRLGAPATFMTDEEQGLPALQRSYAPEFKDVVTVETADIASAIDKNTADCFVVDSLDPVITTKTMTILLDDQYMVTTNAVIVLMDAIVQTPEVTSALDTLAGALTTEVLNRMLNEIRANGTDIAVVANAFADNL